ncbi:DUF1361 domain-containing protein [Streptococcus pneumoniae]
MRKWIGIHVLFVLVSFLVYREGITVQGPDLIWNMFLALVAYNAAFFANRLRQKWLYLAFGVIWFLFYPNTFYMVTDLIHMDWVSKTLWDRQSLHLFVAFVLSIFFGVMCGVESWRLMIKRSKLAWWIEDGLMIGLSFLSSLAIYIGRYDRLNSWDVLHRPLIVLEKLLAALERERWYFVLGFTLLQVMVLLFVNENEEKSKKGNHLS